MEASFRNVIVQSNVVGSRVYSSIPLNATYPLALYEVVDIDYLTTRPEQDSTPGIITVHGTIPTMRQYLVKLSILGKDKSEVRTIRDALEPFINGFNGISLNDEIAIMIDDYRVETRATDANYEVGAFDLTIFHKQGA
ncbi:MAG: hypothetical protein WAS33_07425 [Candidatus Promineifilaceae bacterium]